MENKQEISEKTNFNYLDEIRKNYDISDFSNLERGQHKLVASRLGVKSGVISRISYEARILNLFPNLEKSKSIALARLRLDKELILFSKKYDIYNLSVKQIYTLVKQWRKDIENNPKLILTDLQHDLIIGSTLGDSNIRQRNKNCMFRVGHSPKQKKYIEWKFEILKEFNSKGIKLTQRVIKDRLVSTHNLDINTHYVFNFYRKLFYNNGIKVITREILDYLTPRSLAIWLCDDGSYCKRLRYIILCTNSYSLEEHKVIKKYFEEVWELSPTIGFRDNEYYYLRFKVEDTKKLVEIVKPFIPKSMGYKIGEKNE